MFSERITRVLLATFLLLGLCCHYNMVQASPETKNVEDLDYVEVQETLAATSNAALQEHLHPYYRAHGGLVASWLRLTLNPDGFLALQAGEKISRGDPLLEIPKTEDKDKAYLSTDWVINNSGLAEMFDLMAGYPVEKTMRKYAIPLWMAYMESVRDNTTAPYSAWPTYYVYSQRRNPYELITHGLLEKYGQGFSKLFLENRLEARRKADLAAFNEMFPKLANEFPELFNMQHIKEEKFLFDVNTVNQCSVQMNDGVNVALVPWADLFLWRSPNLPEDVRLGFNPQRSSADGAGTDIAFFADAERDFKTGEILRRRLEVPNNLIALADYGITFPEFWEAQQIPTPWGEVQADNVPVTVIREVAAKKRVSIEKAWSELKDFLEYQKFKLYTTNDDQDALTMVTLAGMPKTHPFTKHLIQLRGDDRRAIDAIVAICDKKIKEFEEEAKKPKKPVDPREDL